MPNRSTPIGRISRRDRGAARAEVTRVLTRCEGCIVAAARDFGIERRQMLRLVHRFSLWPLVWSLRRVAKREPDISEFVIKRGAP